MIYNELIICFCFDRTSFSSFDIVMLGKSFYFYICHSAYLLVIAPRFGKTQLSINHTILL